MTLHTKNCINCGITKPICFLCGECWRVAILSPIAVALAGGIGTLILKGVAKLLFG